jgi:hypothetical protein
MARFGRQGWGSAGKSMLRRVTPDKFCDRLGDHVPDAPIRPNSINAKIPPVRAAQADAHDGLRLGVALPFLRHAHRVSSAGLGVKIISARRRIHGP